MGGEVSVLVEAMTSSETANALVEQAATVQLNQTVEEDFFDSYYPSSGSCSQGYQKMTGGSQDVYTDFPTEFQAGIRLRAVTVGEYGYSTWQVTRKSYQGEGGSIMCEEGTESRTGGSYSREKRATFTFDIQKVVHQKLSGRYVYGRGFLTVIPPDPNENFSGGLVLSCTGPLGWEKPCPDGLTEEIIKTLSKEKELSIRQISLKVRTHRAVALKSLEFLKRINLVKERKGTDTKRIERLFSLK